MAAAAAVDPRPGRLEADLRDAAESDEEEEVESDDEGSEAGSLADADAGSHDDPTFDPDADGCDAVLRARMSRLTISASARKDRKGSAAPKMGKEEIDLVATVDKLMQEGELKKLKVDECKVYLRMHKLRLTGKKEVLLNRIREFIEVRNAGGVKYPVESFVLNCKGDACKGDVVMFEQNIYRRKKGAPRGVQGRLCGQRTNAGRIIKESYGTAKQQHTFTIEILWSKGYKPWPPLHPLLIKGRNLYKDKTMRQPWPDEQERKRVLDEKHARGFVARKSRAVRIQEKEMAKSNRIKVNKSKEHQNMNLKSSQEVVQGQKMETTGTVHQRSDKSKGLPLQNAEPGKPSVQHVPSNGASTQQNVVFPQNGATSTFKQEFINRQAPFIQPGMTRLQQTASNTAPTQQNIVRPQNGATRTFNQEFINHQVISIQYGGSQQQIFSKPTNSQQVNRASQQQPHYQHRDGILLQESATMTSRNDCTGRQAPSQHNGGPGISRQQQMSSKPTSSQQASYQQQPARHHDHKEALPRDGVRAYSEDFANHQNNSYHATRYNEPAVQHQGRFSQHAHAYQRGSSHHQNTRANHQVHQPSRARNQDFDSRGQFYDQDYQDYYNYTGSTQDYYYPEQNWQQNYYDRRQAIQGQYHTQQNHHQNHDGHRRTNQKQNHHQQGQPQGYQAQLQPCRYFYEDGYCPYGHRCRYSHGF